MAFSLKAVFGLDATGLKTELKQVRRELNSFVNDYAKLGAGIAVGAFLALSKSALDLAAQLKDTSFQLGINVEKLQALHYAATQNGSSVESMNKALEKLRLNTQAAFEGNDKFVGALQTLNLTATQLVGIPLEKKYELVARAYANSTNKAAAYNAVSELFGNKIGPDQIAILDSLAKDGFDKVAASAAKAGQVMTAETIVALEKASQAIDDFKKQATIAVGNIIVNFRSEEGLKLLLYQFLKVAGTFGAKVVDAVIEGGQFAGAVFGGAFRGVANIFRNAMVDVLGALAVQINRILPAKFAIDVTKIEALKTAGEGIAASITRAIAETKPSTFAADVTKFWDKAIRDQQNVVNALNRTELGNDAQKLKDAGKMIEDGGRRAADALVEGGKKTAASLENAYKRGEQAMDIKRREIAAIVDGAFGMNFDALNGATLAGLSSEALQELVQQNKVKIDRLLNPALNPGDQTNTTGYLFDNRLRATGPQAELGNAQRELDLRSEFARAISGPGGVEGARRYYDPVIFEKLLQQFGPGSQDFQQKSLTAQQKLYDLLKNSGITVKSLN